MTEEEIDRRAQDKAKMMDLENQIKNLFEQNKRTHDLASKSYDILYTGNGVPPHRHEVPRLSEVTDEVVQRLGSIERKLERIEDWVSEKQDNAQTWKEKLIESVTSALITATVLGIGAWIAWSVKMYVESGS